MFNPKLNQSNRLLLADALHNLHKDSGASLQYCKGMVIGIISALMYEGRTYSECISLIFFNLPAGYKTGEFRLNALPQDIQDLINK